MKTKKTLVLLFLLWPPLVACASKPYVLPIADGGPEPSPPSLQGRIAKVELGRIVVSLGDSPADAGSVIIVRFTSATEIFTVYGAYVQASQLVAGHRVRVWCARLTKPKPGDVIAAAKVMIASKDPNDD